ncbi:pyridine nucleotide-disulfide oxidoreductase [Bradyrhizobium sp.]|uniref:pyridine nucleotide-disulfide oxidoreductase n=1 Tax=Bradyrhizobium sp. TaxID=376 RepID=UPI001D72D41D|nr:pyridine nucleotide-disulfide oxidoreductase [Bradyrhizobium sp.]MBI5319473.1 pyridine nucleotide-disulfide oxidoreductase [Bradyrhizobium sp.]
MALIAAAGWFASGEEYLTPKAGPGYWLGIAGSTAMLCLLLYSFRKRFKAARPIGSVRFWFRTHMLLGVTGPLLILFHSNFRLGPLNSNVALFSMLIVAFSGVVGKFIYGKIHMGLHGSRARARELLAEADNLKHQFGDEKVGVLVSRELNAFSDGIASEVRASVLTSLWGGAVLAVRARRIRARLLSEANRLIRIEARTSGWSRRQRRARQQRIVELVTLYSEAVLKAAELAFYERLFALWHVLHLPLFFLMLATGLIHVWAVHQY